jgi:C4-dicarboxylate-specific signal transduction histidine kinase
MISTQLAASIVIKLDFSRIEESSQSSQESLFN